MAACIVCGVDFTDASRRAFDSATALAGDLAVPLVLVHAYGHAPVPATVPRETLEEFRRVQAADLAALVHRLTQRWAEQARQGGVHVETVVLEGRPEEVLLRVADEKEAAMTVVGTHSRGAVARLLLGSVAEAVVRRSRRPVLVVPDRD